MTCLGRRARYQAGQGTFLRQREEGLQGERKGLTSLWGLSLCWAQGRLDKSTGSLKAQCSLSHQAFVLGVGGRWLTSLCRCMVGALVEHFRQLLNGYRRGERSFPLSHSVPERILALCPPSGQSGRQTDPPGWFLDTHSGSGSCVRPSLPTSSSTM